jgi:hypothetical protein
VLTTSAHQIREKMSGAGSLSAVAVLRFVENRTHKEIAQRLKVPFGTVSFLVCEASMQLHARLKSCIDVTPNNPPEHSESGDQQ